MECYCVTKKKPIRCEKSKPQTAMVISLWFWCLFACPGPCCDWSLHNQQSWNISGVHGFLSKAVNCFKTIPWACYISHLPSMKWIMNNNFVCDRSQEEAPWVNWVFKLFIIQNLLCHEISLNSESFTTNLIKFCFYKTTAVGAIFSFINGRTVELCVSYEPIPVTLYEPFRKPDIPYPRWNLESSNRWFQW